MTAGERTESVSFWEGARADLAEIAKVKGTPYPSIGGLIDVLTLPGTWSMLTWRAASTLHHRGLRPLSRMLYFLNMVVFGAELQPGVILGAGIVIPHPVGMGVASGTRIGSRVRLLRATAVGGSGDPDRPGHATIGDDVWVMDGAKVFGPVTIGDRSILGTNAVVSADVPPDMFVYGARRSDVMRPLAEMGLADHNGSLPTIAVAAAQAESHENPGTGPGPEAEETLRLARASGDV